MKINIKKVIISSVLAISVLGLVGCDKKPESAFQIYDTAYENTIAENNITLNDKLEYDYTDSEGTNISKSDMTFKKLYNSKDDYKLSFDLDAEQNNQKAKLEGYVENNDAYIIQNGEKHKTNADYNDVLSVLAINYVNIAEESIKNQSFEKKPKGCYEVTISLDKDKFTELLATKYKNIDEIYSISNSFDVDEVTIKATINKNKRFDSTDVEIKGSQPLDEKGENVNNIVIKHNTAYSDYGKTVIEKPDNLEEYEDASQAATETPNEANAEANDAPAEMQTNK